MFYDPKIVPNIKLQRSVFVGTDAHPVSMSSIAALNTRSRGKLLLYVLTPPRSITIKMDSRSLSSINKKQK